VPADDSDSEDLVEETHEPRECMPCGGRGKLISGLGGTPSPISCPWCGGSGMRVPSIDAQAHWGPRDDAAPRVQESPPPPTETPAAAEPQAAAGE
jgi:hypothetical protein